MKRSGDVTASVIILFFGSGLVVVVTLLTTADAMVTRLPPEQRAVLYIMAIFYALAAAWGIATGVGILQLRPGARISIIVMSAMAIVLAVCGGIGMTFVPLLLRQVPDAPAAAIKMIVFVGIGVLLIPLAIAIWWLVLFTRKRVVLEFAIRRAAHPLSEMSSAPLTSFAPPLSATATSVRVIAIMILAIAPFSFFSVVNLMFSRFSTIFILGVVITGPAWMYVLLLFVAQVSLPIAILRSKRWGLYGLAAYLLFTVVNALLFMVSPGKQKFVEAVVRGRGLRNGMSFATMTSAMNIFLTYVMCVSALLGGVALYFVLTSRKAYWLACETRRAVT